MELNKFVNLYIHTDERRKALNKLQSINNAYYKMHTYFNKIMNPEFSLLLNILKEENIIYYTKVSDIIPHHRYCKLIKYLITEDFIEIDHNLNIDFKYNKPNIYKLNQKGKDLIRLKVVKEFLEETYK